MDKGTMVKDMILQEMEKQGLSSNKLGEMSGMQGRSIRYWQQGVCLPTITAADKALKALEMSVVLGKEGKDE